MQKFVKLIMSAKGESITLPWEKAEKITEAKDEQFFKIFDDKGEWTGKWINKAHIVLMVPDTDADDAFRIRNTSALPDPDARPKTPEEMESIKKTLERTREKLKEKGVL